MNQEQTFLSLKSYIENDAVLAKAFRPIHEGTELGLTLGESMQCAIIRRGEGLNLENRPAENPDLVIRLKPESVFVLKNQKIDDVPDLAIALFKEFLAGHLQVKVRSQAFDLNQKGYLQALREGGAKLKDVAQSYSMTGLAKTYEWIQKLTQKK